MVYDLALEVGQHHFHHTLSLSQIQWKGTQTPLERKSVKEFPGMF